ncbi:DUF3606 domain-containing protein [Caulobacter sp. CCG-8]|uniref:DUF3606 domain-containing protein n=1 Tax=Caulobacter sp. CCG-8 TaxID=3127958 RepID=UPI00307CE66E
MADNLQDRGTQDRARVNVNEPHEVRYWTEKFGVSEEDLVQAVTVVGVSAAEVERYLKKD